MDVRDNPISSGSSAPVSGGGAGTDNKIDKNANPPQPSHVDSSSTTQGSPVTKMTSLDAKAVTGAGFKTPLATLLEKKLPYHGELTSAQVKALFAENEGNVYLLRLSSGKNSMTMQVREPSSGRIAKLRVIPRDNGKIELGGDHGGYGTLHDTLEEALKSLYKQDFKPIIPKT